MRVLVVAEIRLYREGVAQGLRALPEVQHVATAANGALAVAAAQRSQCDVVLLDMAIDSGIQTAVALLTARPSVRVIALGVREEGPDVVACAETGVSGYVSRDASFDDLASAIRAAMRGEVSCSAKIAAGLIRHIALHARSHRVSGIGDTLTRREREVLLLIQADMSNKEIARTLGIELSTVKNHVHRLLTKLGVSGRRELALAAMRRDLDFNLTPDGSPDRSGAIASR
ncbi:LuxR C-terminal-related transcriptional regulator [Mycobacterium sp. C3-094]